MLNCLFQIELSINRLTFLRGVGGAPQRNVRLTFLAEQIDMYSFPKHPKSLKSQHFLKTNILNMD